MNLKGQAAIVTGAGSGIGRAVAETFAEAGIAGVTIADINPKNAKEAEKSLQSRANCQTIVSVTDVSKEDAVQEMVTATTEKFGKVDILVNNAGICPLTPWDETTLKDWNHILDVNLTGAYLCTKAVLPHMRQRRYGRIIYISSVGAFLGSVVAHVAYGVSKAGMIALMKSVAKEFGAEGINANAISPGPIDTPMRDGFGEEIKRRLVEGVPLKRAGTAGELADAVLFLASKRASYVNGATLHVNGGSLLI